MFKASANVAQRIARTVLVPSGPLIAVIALGTNSRGTGSERAHGILIMLALVWFFCSLLLVPALVFREDSSPGASADDDGGHGGPPEPPARGPDRGGWPLPDAEQARERVRDHVRPQRQWLKRRASREPGRAPDRQVDR